MNVLLDIWLTYGILFTNFKILNTFVVVLDSGAQTFEYRLEGILKTSKFEIVSPLPYQPNKKRFKVEVHFKVAKIQLKKVNEIVENYNHQRHG